MGRRLALACSPWPSSCHVAPKTHSFRAALSSPESEAVRSGLRSDRLFFEPGFDTRSIVAAAAPPFEGSAAAEMESGNPYRDFKVSMEEVVVAHGVRDWDTMEEILSWYLRVNGKGLREVIVGAFVDMITEFAASSPSAVSSSSFSCSSSSTFEIHEEVKKEKRNEKRSG